MQYHFLADTTAALLIRSISMLLQDLCARLMSSTLLGRRIVRCWCVIGRSITAVITGRKSTTLSAWNFQTQSEPYQMHVFYFSIILSDPAYCELLDTGCGRMASPSFTIIYTHHCNLVLFLEADTHFTVPQRVKGWVWMKCTTWSLGSWLGYFFFPILAGLEPSSKPRRRASLAAVSATVDDSTKIIIIIIIIIHRQFLTRRNTTKSLQGRAMAWHSVEDCDRLAC